MAHRMAGVLEEYQALIYRGNQDAPLTQEEMERFAVCIRSLSNRGDHRQVNMLCYTPRVRNFMQDTRSAEGDTGSPSKPSMLQKFRAAAGSCCSLQCLGFGRPQATTADDSAYDARSEQEHLEPERRQESPAHAEGSDAKPSGSDMLFKVLQELGGERGEPGSVREELGGAKRHQQLLREENEELRDRMGAQARELDSMRQRAAVAEQGRHQLARDKVCLEAVLQLADHQRELLTEEVDVTREGLRRAELEEAKASAEIARAQQQDPPVSHSWGGIEVELEDEEGRVAQLLDGLGALQGAVDGESSGGDWEEGGSVGPAPSTTPDDVKVMKRSGVKGSVGEDKGRQRKAASGLSFGVKQFHFGRGGRLTTAAATVVLSPEDIRVYAPASSADRGAGTRRQQKQDTYGPLLVSVEISSVVNVWAQGEAVIVLHREGCMWVDVPVLTWGSDFVAALGAHEAIRRRKIQIAKRLPPWALGDAVLPPRFPSGPIPWPLWRGAVLLLAHALRRGHGSVPPALIKRCCSFLPPGVFKSTSPRREAVAHGAGNVELSGGAHLDDAPYCRELHGDDGI
eukprot:TRINITY_DN45754_c0_g1_i1.p1 TRINITY_DN45754_c0_g1~~TRINITY_DN45754_c0_g1_i1.p1  ORF type:complete len:593 (+),score=165.65 TRINITY_DN45754_c0_g1_i1:70-1779(+)